MKQNRCYGSSPPFLNNDDLKHIMRTTFTTFGRGRLDHAQRMLFTHDPCPERSNEFVNALSFLVDGPHDVEVCP